MNKVREELLHRIEKEEKRAGFQGKYRMKYHLMPPVGWLNDPNGLCQFQGIYHVFFQYSPLDAKGGIKGWGHYTGRDLLHWKYAGVELLPDQEIDRDGVYSGSALTLEDGIFLYYTGNVKQAGEHDYIYSGREANTIRVVSPDGRSFEKKELLLTNKEYPAQCTCHVRDPKVWQESGCFYMIQGARMVSGQKGGEDFGAVLLFGSEDGEHWDLYNQITTPERFGYMWECPDYFCLLDERGDNVQILSLSPQGLKSEQYRYQNIYQSGYFCLNGDITLNVSLEGFTEWDMGFDFYAPQTFEDEQGRRIMIGWAGIPDADYDNEPTVREGWQHCLTVPRELTWKRGKVLQNPVSEISLLRGESVVVSEGIPQTMKEQHFDLLLTEIASSPAKISFSPEGEEGGLTLEFQDGICTLSFVGDCRQRVGRGRLCRRLQIGHLEQVRVLVDGSIVEIYLNGGEYVFTSRYYIEGKMDLLISCKSSENRLWYMQGYEISGTKLLMRGE